MWGNTEVVILAAGDSSRLFPVTRDFPKCLLRIGGETLLTNMLNSFVASGVSKFTVVAGYKHLKLIPFTRPVNARFIVNRAYRSTDSLYSLWLTKRAYEGDLIIANSDVYVDSLLLGKIVQSPENCALIARTGEWDPESTKVLIRRGRIVLWSRTLPRGGWSGENIGIVKICQPHVQPFYDEVAKLMGSGGKARWWPDALNLFATKCRITPIDTEGGLCKEIDTAQDYADLLEKLQVTVRA
jgi:choline kinase